MRFKICVFLFFILLEFSQETYSQSENKSVKQKSTYQLHLISPGFCTEQKLSPDFTAVFKASLGMSFYYNDRLHKNKLSLIFNQYISLELREYTDLLTRQKRGKKTENFSGTYGAIRYSNGYYYLISENYYQIGPLIGLQRSLFKKFIFNIECGVGVTVINKSKNTGIIGDISFGYVF